MSCDGLYELKVDEKFRIALPRDCFAQGEFKHAVPFIILARSDHYELYSPTAFLQATPALFDGLYETEPDSHGRIVLHRDNCFYRGKFDRSPSVVLFGAGNHYKLYSRAVWEAIPQA